MKAFLLGLSVILLIVSLWIISRSSSNPIEPPGTSNSGPNRLHHSDSELAQRHRTQPLMPAPLTPTTDGHHSQQFKSASEEREYLVSSMRQSGAATGAWASRATSDIDAAIQSTGSLRVEASGIECYEKGCLISLRYKDLATYNLASSSLDDAPPLLRWARAFTGPEINPESQAVSNALLVFSTANGG